ncbi:MAG: MaoC family dehydratase N-terminal domain-containing protein [Alphaproteobacteria bacterium]|nr:MaoC family dehydratase N-terminal domain-containing protein [Alphaproteobacteria bacterium]
MADEIKMPVEASHIMMFARAVADDNPIYRDAEYAKTTEVGHIIAPPTFPRAVSQFDPDYAMRPRIGEKWFGSGKNPTGLDKPAPSSGGLHAEQHFEYHQPLKPGDQLTVTQREGETWERESKRAGKLTFLERIQEYRNQDGELVITSRAVSVRTERPVEQS